MKTHWDVTQSFTFFYSFWKDSPIDSYFFKIKSNILIDFLISHIPFEYLKYKNQNYNRTNQNYNRRKIKMLWHMEILLFYSLQY